MAKENNPKKKIWLGLLIIGMAVFMVLPFIIYMHQTKDTFVVETDTDKQDFIETDNQDITGDSGPTITGMKDFYVIPGTTLNYLEFIRAYDTEDGDLTSSAYVNAENVDLSKVGSYSLTYICEDSSGLVAKEVTKVNVLDSLELQSLINTHQIDRTENIIVGAPNLYDCGYYEGKTIEEMQEIMEPSIVQLHMPGQSQGGGFIVNITEDEIILCTNHHVVGDLETMWVYFHEGSSAEGKVVYTNYEEDIAFLIVSLEEIEKDLLDTLYTVHINKGYWDNLDNTEPLMLGIRTINRDGTVWQDSSGKMLYKETEALIVARDRFVVLESEVNNFEGSSGSAVFDEKGNLIAMVYARTYGEIGTHNYNVPLPDICEAFYEAFGREIYYY